MQRRQRRITVYGVAFFTSVVKFDHAKENAGSVVRAHLFVYSTQLHVIWLPSSICATNAPGNRILRPVCVEFAGQEIVESAENYLPIRLE